MLNFIEQIQINVNFDLLKGYQKKHTARRRRHIKAFALFTIYVCSLQFSTKIASYFAWAYRRVCSYMKFADYVLMLLKQTKTNPQTYCFKIIKCFVTIQIRSCIDTQHMFEFTKCWHFFKQIQKKKEKKQIYVHHIHLYIYNNETKAKWRKYCIRVTFKYK